MKKYYIIIIVFFSFCLKSWANEKMPQSLACKASVNVSLSNLGTAEISPQIVLQTMFSPLDCYQIYIVNEFGENLGTSLTCDNLGQTLNVNVTDTCDGAACWSVIVLSDYLAPQINCPSDQIQLDCFDSLVEAQLPTATDNCSTDIDILVLGFEVDNSVPCANTRVTRTFVAVDGRGNISTECEQVIEFLSPALPFFPKDITWQCFQFDSNPNILDAALLNTNIVDQDITTEEVNVDVNVDAVLLAATGSGIVDVAGGQYCNYNVEYADELLTNECSGVLVLRTWSVLNWCTGEVIETDANGDNNVQVINIKDEVAPIILAEDFDIEVNMSASNFDECNSTEPLLVPQFSDECGSVVIRIFTSVGEADYVNDYDASQGASIPQPGLGIGEHTITYKATDDCGNETVTTAILNVKDTTGPEAICDEVTEVVLNSDGIGLVDAIYFDDGSHDNCCISHFEVKLSDAPDGDFSSLIEFNCTQAGTQVEVDMKVWDCYDNHSTCEILVNVVDGSQPICVVPDDINIGCRYIVDNQLELNNLDELATEFGFPEVQDDCGGLIEELAPETNLNACGVGLLVRRFVLKDNLENVIQECNQNINILHEPEYTINFPADIFASCGSNEFNQEPTINSYSCDNFSVSTNDFVINLSENGACYKIVRRFDVINECNFFEGAQPVLFNDSHTITAGEIVTQATFGNAPMLRYSQTIWVMDNVAPEVEVADDEDFCVGADCQSAYIHIPLFISDDCSLEFDTAWTIRIDNSDTNILTGIGAIDGVFDLPLGFHAVEYEITDECGNSKSAGTNIEIKDCKAPVAYCSIGIGVSLPVDEPRIVGVLASQLNAGSYDNCGGEVSFSFSANPNDDVMFFNCDDIGLNTVSVYVFDENGNVDVCETLVNVQDNVPVTLTNPCILPDDPIIAGSIKTIDGEGLEQVSIALSNTTMEEIESEENGTYVMGALIEGEDYTVVPSDRGGYNNGVTVSDIIKIKRHILGFEYLDNPYQLIAADVNNSKTVTTADIVKIQRLILQVDQEFVNRPSWVYVDSDFQFNTENPLNDEYPEIININNIESGLSTANFIAIKIGDVNLSANVNLNFSGTQIRSHQYSRVNISKELVESDEIQGAVYLIDLDGQDQITGFQMSFDLQDKNEIKDVFVNDENFHLKYLNNKEEQSLNIVAYSTDGENIDSRKLKFYIEFEENTSGGILSRLSSNFNNHLVTFDEASGNLHEMELRLNNTINSSNPSIGSIKAFPNPFSQQTVISIESISGGEGILKIFDSRGKLIALKSKDLQIGHNEFILRGSELNQTGILFYHFIHSGVLTKTQKIIRINN